MPPRKKKDALPPKAKKIFDPVHLTYIATVLQDAWDNPDYSWRDFLRIVRVYSWEDYFQLVAVMMLGGASACLRWRR